MSNVLFFFIMLFSSTSLAATFECETVILPSNVPGPTFYYSKDMIFTLDHYRKKKILFDDNHFCGTENTTPDSRLQHIITDMTNTSNYQVDVEGKTFLVKEGSQIDVLASLFTLYYGLKDPSNNIGGFMCGLDDIKIHLILKNCR